MMPNLRGILVRSLRIMNRRSTAATIAAISLIALVGLWWRSAGSSRSLESGLQQGPLTPTAIRNADIPGLLVHVTDEAVAAWRGAGLPEEDCRQLRHDITELLGSVAGADFDRALELQRSRGADLSPRAVAIAETVFRAGDVGNITADTWSSLSETERVKMAWNAQWGGPSRWTEWDPGDVDAGLGVQSRRLPEGHSNLAAGTMFAFEGDSEIVGRARDGRAPVAWLSFPLRLGDSEPGLFMVVLVKDESGVWRPMLMSITGPGQHPMIFF